MKRSILGLIHFIHALRKLGTHVDERLASIGLTLDDLDHTTLLHPRVEWRIFEIITADIHPEQGLWIGQEYTLVGYGPLLMLLMACPTLQVAFKKGEQYHALTHLIGRIYVERDAGFTIMHYQPQQTWHSREALLRAQAEVAGTFKFIQDFFKMIRMPMPEIQVKLPFQAPHHPDMLQQYYAYYGADLLFNMPQMEFHFKADFANMAIPSANAYSLKTIERQCAEELKRLQGNDSESGVVQRVKDYLSLQHIHIPSMAETAQALDLPERTLRHQLKLQQSSYKQIRETLLKQKSLKLLQEQQYSIEHVAELLGYSESAAFNHAFKRWFGLSPKQYLKQ